MHSQSLFPDLPIDENMHLQVQRHGSRPENGGSSFPS